MAALNLATSSAGTRPRSFTSVPCALARSLTSAGFSPLTDTVRPAGACRRLPGGSHAARQRVTQRPGMPGDQADLLPGAVQPDADGAVAPYGHHGHRSAEPVPAEP